MERFVFKLFCVFYLAMAVNTRSINHSKNNNIFGLNKYKERKDKIEDHTYSEIDQILTSVTTKVNDLKNAYSTEKYKVLLPKLDKVAYPHTSTVTSTTEDLDFVGTAQIEALLNDIKARAIQMVAEQNPSVTDMITNSVTETTFEADPLLKHIDVTSPGYALTTFVCLNNIDKRRANNSNYAVVAGLDSHKVTVRSVKENAYTIAQNVEDVLQKELKSFYKKIKEKVSKDFHSEVKSAQSTLKKETCKVINKITKIGGSTPHLTTNKGTTKSRQNRGNKNTKSATNEETTITPTLDDFAMLTLYEQILAKTHEDNVMKMLATNKKRKIDETVRLSKRNPETLTDINLKKDIKRMYDDEENIPDIDYNNDVMLPQSTNDDPSMMARKSNSDVNTEETPEDTSYEGLSNKIAYKDYVNGFKSYLKFQRDEARENFSALVKYQAHKHHNVDDIGKFILNKIPQIPSRSKRHFFDELDVDDQDISTKSDDSWFKKHFYMFLDTGPPKKYHTSETVEFRDVTEANKVDYQDVMEKPESQAARHQGKDMSGINLDELTRDLEDRKKSASVAQFIEESNLVTTQDTKMSNNDDSGIVFKVYAPNILSKLFKKRQKVEDTDGKSTEKTTNKGHTLKLDDEEQINEDNFIFNADLTRVQRKAEKEKGVEEESIETTLKQNAKTDKPKTDEKLGYASMVTQATAIVNLHKTNAKLGRVQRLLNKLHFRRSKTHKKKKEKRHCTRIQRFNPLRKLKNMFACKQDAKNTAMHEDIDYDLLKAHIDTFKPVKYNRIPTMDELQRQLPNITSDLIDEIMKGETTFKNINDNVKDDYTFSPTNSQTTKPGYTNKVLNKMIEKVVTSDGVMNVNIKTMYKLNDDMSPQPITVEDIRQELEKLNLSSVNQLTTKYELYKSPVTTAPLREGQSFSNDVPDSYANATLPKVAKYPRKQFKKCKTSLNAEKTVESSRLYEFADSESYWNIHDEAFPLGVTEKITTSDSFSQLKKYDQTSTVAESTTKFEEVKFKDMSLNYKTYPDYFHDLVRWNNDILNYDKVSNPTWQDILKNIKGSDEYTTPNVQWIRQELSDMKDYLRKYNIEFMAKDMKEKIAPTVMINEPNLFLLKQKYISKPIDTKLQKVKVNNEMKQNIDDLHEDSFVRDDAKGFSSHRTQDIINVINNLHTKRNYYGVKGNAKMKNNEVTKSLNSKTMQKATATREAELFFKGSTESIFNTKKLSKYALTTPAPKHKDIKPKAHVNKMPKQFYNTPLPMKKDNFDKFLMEHKLDVKTLTSPISKMPEVTESWYSKLNSLTKMMTSNVTDKNPVKLTNATVSVKPVKHSNVNINKMYPENQIEYLNELEQDLIDDDVNIRDKRFNVKDYDSYKDSALFGTEKIRHMKNKLSYLFDKKPEARKSITESVTDANDDLEITIINFEDYETNSENKPTTDSVPKVYAKVDSTTKKLATIESESTTKVNNTKTEKNKGKLQQYAQKSAKAGEIDTNIFDFMTVTEKVNQTSHSSLTDERDPYIHYNEKGSEKETNISAEKERTQHETQHTSDHDKNAVFKEPEVLTVDQIEPSVLKVNGQKGNPKRVLISSHSYKYDVVYNAPGQTVEKEAILNEENEIDVDPLKDNKKSKNSDEVRDSKGRAVRAAKTTSKRRTFSQTIHFATQAMKLRNKRLLEILPMLKNKFKMLARLNSSATLKSTAANKTTPNTLNFETTKLTTAFSNSTATTRKERNYALKYKAGGIFDYKVITTDNTRKANKNTEHTTKRHNREVTDLSYVETHKNKSGDYVEGNSNYDMFYYEAETIKAPANLESKSQINGTQSSEKEMTSDTKLKRDVDNTVYTAKDVATFEVFVDLMRDSLDKMPSNRQQAVRKDTSKDDNLSRTNISDSDFLELAKSNGSDTYVEGNSNYDMIYYEMETIEPPKNLTMKHKTPGNTEERKNKRKRNIDTHTAKDVAALEVIVDLMRNTQNYAEQKPYTPMWPGKRSKEKLEQTTNSIQVHIAVPYDVYNRKRCSDNVKVRKVFTAKLAKPVDLEYQIHSVEDYIASTPSATRTGLTPGMYLIVDDKNKTYILKNIELPSFIAKEGIVDDLDDAKSNKIKVNKDFVVAVNKYLIQLYKNLTMQNKICRNVRDTGWFKFKKHLTPETVCKCKCVVNKPMCRTCAACDPVIKELVFEFENLAKYMNDHCSEIQTYFWMNPTGGRALRDTVHKLDKSLNDYFKRVKGKCMGSKCKTFATFLDKREFNNNSNKNYIGEPLLRDLKQLNDNFELTASFIPYDDNLKEMGEEFLNVVGNCIRKQIVKREDCHEKTDKDVYTLDNITVNIICNPDTPCNQEKKSLNNNCLTVESKTIATDQMKRVCKKCKTRLGKKNKTVLQKIFTLNKGNVFKREDTNQVESPLIADTGGSFWHDYLKGNSMNELKGDLQVSVVQNSANTAATSTKLTFKDKLKNIRKIKVRDTPKTSVKVTNAFDASTEVTEASKDATKASTDMLSYSMNELFDYIRTLKDVTENQFTFDPTIIARRNQTTKAKKIKTKKHRKIHKTSKAKVHRKHKEKTKMHTDYNSTHATTNDVTKTGLNIDNIEPTYNLQEMTQYTDVHYSDINELLKENTRTTKMNLLDKIKTSISFLNLGSSIDHSIHANGKTENKNNDTNVISDATTESNPSILIINNDNTHDKDKSKFKSILLSFLNYESSKLDKERAKLNDGDVKVEISHQDLDEEHTGHGQPKAAVLHYEREGVQGVQTTAPVRGLLQRVAQRFGVKGSKVAASPTKHLKPKNHHHTKTKTKTNSKIIEETDPTINKRIKSTNPNSEQAGYIYPNDMRNAERNIKRTGESTKNRNTEFDSYMRHDHGIYRLRRRNVLEDGRALKMARRNVRFKRRKKQKRSSVEFNNRQRLSVWLQHSAGSIVATITCFYIVLASFAAVMNWVFGR